MGVYKRPRMTPPPRVVTTRENFIPPALAEAYVAVFNDLRRLQWVLEGRKYRGLVKLS